MKQPKMKSKETDESENLRAKSTDVKNRYLLDLFGQRVNRNSMCFCKIRCFMCANDSVCLFHKMYVSRGKIESEKKVT